MYVNDLPVTLKGKFLLRYDLLRYRLARVPEKVCMWIAWRLPQQMVYWCAIRLIAHASTGKYSSQIVPELTAMDALQRWDEKQ